MDKPQTALDDFGINVLDPHDKRGIKSHYITLIQEMALRRYIPAGNGRQLAVDVGCGYGRLSSILGRQGWQTIGIDPSAHLLAYAKANYSQVYFCQGSLPYLPLAKSSVDLILLQNVLRPLRLIGMTAYTEKLAEFLSTGGYLIVVDNIRSGHPDYFSEQELIQLFVQQGLDLTARFPIRAGRWWLLYLIRYGLISQRWLPRIAAYELAQRRYTTSFPSWQYMNIMYIFCWPAARAVDAK
jgi:SAM-dependent methyltransferase